MRRRADPVVVLSLALVFAACGWAVREHLRVPVLPYDDAFITYRYVENVARGFGLSYNPPERVWGFTSPLYLGWLTALRYFFPAADLPTLAVRANAVFVVLAGLTTLLLVRRYSGDVRIAAFSACLLLVHPSLLSISSGGMESVLFLWLVLLALLALAGSRHAALAGFLIGLSCLARPEGVLLLPLALLRYRRSPRELLWLLAAAALVGVPWLVFAEVYFGSFVPLPIVAKNRPLYPLPPGHALDVILGYLGPTLLGHWWARSTPRDVAASLVVLGSVAACVVQPRMRERYAWMPGTFAVLAVALYWYGNPMFFEWYWPAVQATALLSVVLGWMALWDKIRPAEAGLYRNPVSVEAGVGRAGSVGAGFSRPMTAIAVLWLLAITIAAYGDSAGGHSWSIRFVDQDGRRLRIVAYRKIGEVLTRVTGGSVAAAEVGALGYYFGGRMIDACGLVSPEAIQFLPVPEDQRIGPAAGAVSVDFVRGTYPDWVVTMPIFAEKSLLQSEWFSKYYQLAWRVRLPKITFDSEDVLVFRRVDH